VSVNRAEIGKVESRDNKGRFAKGNTTGGRKPLPDEFKAVCRENALPALLTMVEIYQDKEQDANKRIAAGKVIIEYAYGKPKESVDLMHELVGETRLILWKDDDGD
jgi:hypothetical protein